jgi:hypothetical protein
MEYAISNRLMGENSSVGAPDPDDDFEIVFERPLDVLLEIKLAAGGQMDLQQQEHDFIQQSDEEFLAENDVCCLR